MKAAEKCYRDASAAAAAILEKYVMDAITEAAAGGLFEVHIDVLDACPDGTSVYAVDLTTTALKQEGFTVGAEADGLRISWAREEDLVC